MNLTILVGTNRADSRSEQLAHQLYQIYQNIPDVVPEVLRLADVPLADLGPHTYGAGRVPDRVAHFVNKINHADGLVIIVPEYNGSYPGALKYFIDFWEYPKSFEYRPVCFLGLGGRFGGLRPVEHLQGVFGYRNAFVYPERVFLSQVWDHLNTDEIKDPVARDLVHKQSQGFIKFIKALKSQQLDAQSLAK